MSYHLSPLSIFYINDHMTDELFSLLLHHLGHLATALPCGTRRQIRPRLAKALDVCSVSEDDRRGPGPGREEIPIDMELPL